MAETTAEKLHENLQSGATQENAETISQDPIQREMEDPIQQEIEDTEDPHVQSLDEQTTTSSRYKPDNLSAQNLQDDPVQTEDASSYGMGSTSADTQGLFSGVPFLGPTISLSPDRIALQFQPIEEGWALNFRELVYDINYQYVKMGLELSKTGQFGDSEDELSTLYQFEHDLAQEYTKLRAIRRGEHSADEIDNHDHLLHKEARALVSSKVLQLKPWVADLYAQSYQDHAFYNTRFVVLNSLILMSIRYIAHYYIQIMTKSMTGAAGESLEGSSQAIGYKELCEQTDEFLDQVDVDARTSGNAIKFTTDVTKVQRDHIGHLINLSVRESITRNPGFRERQLIFNVARGIIPYWARAACMVGVHILAISMVVGLQWNPILSFFICFALDTCAGVAYLGLWNRDAALQSTFPVDPLVQIVIMHFATYVWTTFTLREFLSFMTLLCFLCGLNYAAWRTIGAAYQWQIYNVFAFHYVLCSSHLQLSWLWLFISATAISLGNWVFVWLIMTTYVEYRPLLSSRPIFDVPGFYLAGAILAPFVGKGFTTFWFSILLPVLAYLGWEVILVQLGWRAARGEYVRHILSMLVMNTAMTYLGFSSTQAWLLLMAFEGYKLVTDVAAANNL